MNTPVKPEEMRTEVEATESKESGYVIAMTALMLVPLLVMCAFAVDVGSWYADSARLQRAADAAALASVVYMPDEDAAWQVALDVAAQNGFVSDIGVGGAPVAGGNSTLTFLGEGATVNVTIETDGELFFSQAFLGNVNLARVAQAEYIEEVRMGNPSSGLGMGNLEDPSDVGALANDGFWLAINSSCELRANGDNFVDQLGNNCTGTVNPVGRLPVASGGAGWDGYTFVADMPAGAGAADLQIRNPGFCDNSYFGEVLDASTTLEEPDLLANVYGPDTTPLLASDVLDQIGSRVAGPIVYDGDVYGAACGWQTIYTIPGGAAQRQLYYLKLQADASIGGSIDINTFSLRVKPTAAAANEGLCTSLSDGGCPQIYALDWLPIYRPSFPILDVFGNPTFEPHPDGPPNPPVQAFEKTAEFFLANIPAFHEGKVFELTMFDPGEGMKEIRILDPDGNYVDFEWRRANNFVLEDPGADGGFGPNHNGATTPSCASGDHCLDVTGNAFNGDAIQLRMDLDGYSCQDLGGGNVNCWWKVEYFTQGSGVTDRTNWSVRIIGDPIRLTE